MIGDLTEIVPAITAELKRERPRADIDVAVGALALTAALTVERLPLRPSCEAPRRPRPDGQAHRSLRRPAAARPQRGDDRPRPAQAAPAPRPRPHPHRDLLGLPRPLPHDRDRDDRRGRRERHAAVARPSGLVRADGRRVRRRWCSLGVIGAASIRKVERPDALRGQPPGRGRPDPRADRRDRHHPAALARDTNRTGLERVAGGMVARLRRALRPLRGDAPRCSSASSCGPTC